MNLKIDTSAAKPIFKRNDLIVYEMDSPVSDGESSPYLGVSPTTGKMYVYPIPDIKDKPVIHTVLSKCPDIVNKKEIE